MASTVNTLFAQIGLETYYPQKLTLKDALTLHEETLDAAHCTDPKKWYLFVLKNIMAYHYQCRSKFPLDDLHRNEEKHNNPFEDIEMEVSQSLTVHPMDSLLALILCADDFLRQDLMSRLAKCQFAIPLILPDPHPGCKPTLPLWAMRSVIKEWKSTLNGSKRIREGPIINFAIPIVTFVRFDRQGRSKSKIMNEVFSDSYHAFFHRDNKGGNFDRQLGEGLVDMCWYLPSGKSSDVFPNAVAFLNLHGDAHKHPKQVDFLSQLSLVTFALISNNDINPENEQNTTNILKKLSAAPGGIVILASGDRQALAKFYGKLKDIPKEKLSGMHLDGKNVDGIRTFIRKTITGKIEEKWNTTAANQKTIADCTDIAKANGINIDEEKEEYKKGHVLAEKLQAVISGSTKENLLPLQGGEMWHKWAKEDKEEYRQINRGNKEVQEYICLKKEEKKKIRELQLTKVERSKLLIKTFISILSDQNIKGCIRNYFLHSLKLWMDEQSRENISSLRYDYNEERSKLHQLQIDKKSSKSDIDCAQKLVSELQDKLVKASFGLEHLLREVGQVYEAVHYSAHNPQSHRYSSLPGVAAELLIDGFSLELMDGDAAHVPIEWVKAVLNKLTQMLNNPKIFVVSVLGLQSTGKSTLLNTTFGLHFSVSAGRCTRGAFLQLLPIANNLKELLKCDYIMIVDTEGLRAPEQDSKKARKHDNELATFVTGIANATAINFGGETPGDMDDILQTVVHAFIRMKEAAAVQITPSCQFVYQHVGEVAAEGGLGHFNFKDNLDKMTKAAAAEEEYEGKYEIFNDVIQFDPEKDSHRFPDLWKGDPPMGSVNPGYCDKAIALKHRLVQMVKSKSVKLSTIVLRMKDFWHALLSENFVFRFRNILETQVYTSLEKEYLQWALHFRNEVLQHEQQARNRIKNANIDDLTHLESEVSKSLPEYVHKIHDELESKLTIFFEENEDREMLAQWQAETQNRLKRLERELQEYAKGAIMELISSRKALAGVKEEYKKYQEEIKTKVLKLVAKVEKEDLQGENESEVNKKLKAIFDKKWEKWKKEIERRASVHWEEINIIAVVENSLIDFYKIEEQKIIMKLKEKSLAEWGKELQLEIKDKYITKHGSDDRNETARLRTQKVFNTVEEFLENLQNDYFDPSYVYQLLDALTESIKKSAGVVFTLEYRIDMSLTACGYAMERFKRMIETFRNENNPLMCLEREEKDTLFTMFKNHYWQVAKERVAACTLCDRLTTCVKKQVLNTIGEAVFEKMSRRGIKADKLPQFTNKSALKARILIDLGEDIQKSGDLTEYFLFLENTEKSLKLWIERYTKEFCQSMDNGQTQLVSIANEKLSDLIEKIKKAIKDTRTHKELDRKHEVDTQVWLNDFCSNLSGVLVMENFKDSKDLGGIQILKNIENFEKEVEKGLQKMSKDLQNEFNDLSVQVFDTSENRPHVLFRDLVGCTEQCPFCKEQCDSLMSGHTSSKHQAQQHRPQCLGGYRNIRSRKMVLEICSCDVGSDCTFQDKKTNYQPVPYKDFQKIYPNWAIHVDMSAKSSTYWMWFVGKYSQKIANHFEMLTNDIPPFWKTLTWEEARKEAEAAYKA